MSDTILVVMRLADMRRGHPAQDNTHVCSRCKEPVGIYPSGQHALRQQPELPIICNVCVDMKPGDIQRPTARSYEEFVKEHRDSIDMKRH